MGLQPGACPRAEPWAEPGAMPRDQTRGDLIRGESRDPYRRRSRRRHRGPRLPPGKREISAVIAHRLVPCWDLRTAALRAFREISMKRMTLGFGGETGIRSSSQLGVRGCERILPATDLVAPAKAGAQGQRLKSLGSRFRGNDGMRGCKVHRGNFFTSSQIISISGRSSP